MPSSELELFFRTNELSEAERLQQLKIRAGKLMSLFDEFGLPTLGQMEAPGPGREVLQDHAFSIANHGGSFEPLGKRGLFYPVSPWTNACMKPGEPYSWRTWGITRAKEWLAIEVVMVERLRLLPCQYEVIAVNLEESTPERIRTSLRGGLDQMMTSLRSTIEEWTRTSERKLGLIRKVFDDTNDAEAANRARQGLTKK